MFPGGASCLWSLSKPPALHFKNPPIGPTALLLLCSCSRCCCWSSSKSGVLLLSLLYSGFMVIHQETCFLSLGRFIVNPGCAEALICTVRLSHQCIELYQCDLKRQMWNWLFGNAPASHNPTLHLPSFSALSAEVAVQLIFPPLFLYCRCPGVSRREAAIRKDLIFPHRH